MIASHRLGLLAASISTAILLSACQPSTESTEVTSTDDVVLSSNDTADSTENSGVTTTNNMDAHAGHDMAERTTPETGASDILKEYTKAMTQMHNEMMVGMNYNDPDTAFAKGMLAHHRGAIDMANIELKYGTDGTMQKLAQEIINAQQVEIDILNKWLASHPDAAKPKPETPAMQQAYAAGMNAMHGDMMLGIADPVADMAFARGMLPHHIGAVDMAKVQLRYGKDEEMRQLAQEIITAQQAEIELMKNWIAMYTKDSIPNPMNSDDLTPESNNVSRTDALTTPASS